MRLAVLYDIHGNLPALEAVLEDVRRVGVDEIVVGGDVFPGPMAMDALALLGGLSVPTGFIKGNGDRVVLAARSGADISEVPAAYHDVIEWGAERLDDDIARKVSAWPATLRRRVTGLGDVLFCHATPRNDTEIFTRLTGEDRLVGVFEGINGLAVCGHTHMQFDRIVGRSTRVVNAGSVGMPFGEPGAYWLLLGPDVELRRTSYDIHRAAARIRSTKYPRAEEFAARNILQPPSEQEMLRLYSRVELR
jgi:predicted phosphodiesterase